MALSAELNFNFKCLFLSIYYFLTAMERLIYRYGENLCYGVIFKHKFLSDPSTKVYHIYQVVEHDYYNVDRLEVVGCVKVYSQYLCAKNRVMERR